MTRVCLDCPAPVSRWSKGGRCRACCLVRLISDPEIKAKRLDRLRDTVKSPEHRAKISASRYRLEEERKDDPEWQAMRRAGGDRLRSIYLASPEVQERRAAGTAAVMRFRFLQWCPEERRGEYQILRKKAGAAEARRIIEADIPGTAEHARRQVANNALNMRLKHERQQMDAY